MKLFALALANLFLVLPLSAAQLVIADLTPHKPPVSKDSATSSPSRDAPRFVLDVGQLPVMPPPPSDDNNQPAQPSVPLNDILGTHRALTTFSSLTRLHSSTENLLSDLAENTTVLAPLNSAIDALPRKPWENPSDYKQLGANAYEGGGGQDRAKENLRRFVEAHLVSESPWEEGVKAKTVGGRELWWEKDADGKMIIRPDGVEVDRVASQVANGEVWILKGVINYV